jgi:hypothetical protein
MKIDFFSLFVARIASQQERVIAYDPVPAKLSSALDEPEYGRLGECL